jgi:hypothetical protein
MVNNKIELYNKLKTKYSLNTVKKELKNIKKKYHTATYTDLQKIDLKLQQLNNQNTN